MEPIRSGNRHIVEFNTWSERPSKEQMAVYVLLIGSLRNLSGDCVVFQFHEYLYPLDLEFLRVCKTGSRFHVEVQMNQDAKKLYTTTMTLEDLIDFLSDALRGFLPDVSGWKDITKRGTTKSW